MRLRAMESNPVLTLWFHERRVVHIKSTVGYVVVRFPAHDWRGPLLSELMMLLLNLNHRA